jgi:hypothetical protein
MGGYGNRMARGTFGREVTGGWRKLNDDELLLEK